MLRTELRAVLGYLLRTVLPWLVLQAEASGSSPLQLLGMSLCPGTKPKEPKQTALLLDPASCPPPLPPHATRGLEGSLQLGEHPKNEGWLGQETGGRDGH